MQIIAWIVLAALLIVGAVAAFLWWLFRDADHHTADIFDFIQKNPNATQEEKDAIILEKQYLRQLEYEAELHVK